VSEEHEGSILGKSNGGMLEHLDAGVGNSFKEKLYEGVVGHWYILWSFVLAKCKRLA
jgi:hypothetical protein